MKFGFLTLDCCLQPNYVNNSPQRQAYCGLHDFPLWVTAVGLHPKKVFIQFSLAHGLLGQLLFKFSHTVLGIRLGPLLFGLTQLPSSDVFGRLGR